MFPETSKIYLLVPYYVWSLLAITVGKGFRGKSQALEIDGVQPHIYNTFSYEQLLDEYGHLKRDFFFLFCKGNYFERVFGIILRVSSFHSFKYWVLSSLYSFAPVGGSNSNCDKLNFIWPSTHFYFLLNSVLKHAYLYNCYCLIILNIVGYQYKLYRLMSLLEFQIGVTH